MRFRRFKTWLVVALLSLALEAPLWADSFYGGSASPFFACKEPTVSVGYFTQTGTGATFQRAIGNGLSSFTHAFHARGVWTELTLPVKQGPLGFVLGFGWLFSVPGAAQSTYARSEGPTSRSWNTDAQCYSIRAAVTYDIFQSMTLVGGLRLENFLVTGRNPSLEKGRIGSSIDQLHFTFDNYTPFLGLVVRRPGVAGLAQVNAGVVGWPLLWGALYYTEGVGNRINIMGGQFPGLTAAQEFRENGYFLEAFADCSIPLSYFNLGAFAKFTAFSGSNTVRICKDAADLPTSAIDPFLAFPQVDFQLSFQALNWIVGGQIGIPF